MKRESRQFLTQIFYFLHRIRNGQNRGFRPETFDFIKFTGGLKENVENDIPVIHENPVAALTPLDTERKDPVFFQAFFDMFGDGPYLAV